ncbi:MAG: endonuclease/exonuclease/phosphatase family protein [Ruminococcus sp.]|nr:endonuclease/exonuclease/phosphatase family protein [Ruminococcus sp.]
METENQIVFLQQNVYGNTIKNIRGWSNTEITNLEGYFRMMGIEDYQSELAKLKQKIKSVTPENIDDVALNLVRTLVENHHLQVLFLSEFYYARMKGIEEYLINKEFNIIKPFDGDEIQEDKNYTCSVLLAVKKNWGDFNREKTETDIRHIKGTLSCNDQEIKCFFAYVPFKDRDNKRKKMLDDIKKFIDDNKNNKILVAGDMNTDIGNAENTEFKEIYNMLEDTVPEEKRNSPTWKESRLDYCLVSKGFTEAKTEMLETVSDHKALKTILKLF